MYTGTMSKPSDHSGFRALLEEWNRKLKDSGFKDIEEPRNGQMSLKSSGSDYRFKQVHTDSILMDARVKYYEIIGEKIVETTFDCPTEQKIMTLYFEGKSQADIKKELKVEGHRCKIYRPIYKWLKRWGLK